MGVTVLFPERLTITCLSGEGFRRCLMLTQSCSSNLLRNQNCISEDWEDRAA